MSRTPRKVPAVPRAAGVDLRLGTFNVENLFNRYAFLDRPFGGYKYEQFVMAIDVVSIASRAGDLVAEPTTIIQRNNTALAIEELNADVLAVNEIENMYTLRNFNNTYLSDLYDHVISIDGNDSRSIDVGLYIRHDKGIEVLGVRTHIDDAIVAGERVIREARPGFGYSVTNAIFSRDCLEVDLGVGGKVVTLLVNHLKSQDGTPQSVVRRRRQAERVAELVGVNRAAGRLPVVIGDLNIDREQTGYDGSLDAIFALGLGDAWDALPAGERWTQFYESKRSVSRLDYILADPALNPRDVQILRKGLSTKCKQYTGPRYPTIGPVNTEASDHCPCAVTITV